MYCEYIRLSDDAQQPKYEKSITVHYFVYLR